MDISKIKVLDSSGNEKYDYLFKILIIGSSGVGKSSLLSRFTTNEFTIGTKATIGVEFSTKMLQIDDKIVKAQIWDTAGQERFRAIASSFYRGAIGVLMCFDLTNVQSYVDVDKWLDEIDKFSSSCDIKFGEGSTVILVGNKSDLRHLRVVTEEESMALVERRKLATYIETSAADTSNVEKAFLEVIGLAFMKSEEKAVSSSNQGKENVVNLDKTNENKAKSKCC